MDRLNTINNTKKGLVIIYDPHALLMFLRFYCATGYSVMWDVLCLPMEGRKDTIEKECEDSNIFEHLYVGKSDYFSIKLTTKMKLFLSMFFCAVIGGKKLFAKRFFGDYGINIERYDYLVANTENGLASGMISLWGKKKKVIYFEDGLGDYIRKRYRFKSGFKWNSFENIQCVALSLMGYCGKGFTYLRSTKYCVKYATNMDELQNDNYKNIYNLRLSQQQLDKYTYYLKKIYPQLSIVVPNDGEKNLVFTEPYGDTDGYLEYIKDFIDIISQDNKKIYLKRHPRDNNEYVFPKGMEVVEIPQNIPAEVILPFFKGGLAYFMISNSIFLELPQYEIDVRVLYSDSLHTKLKEVYPRHVGKDEMIWSCETFVPDRYEIVYI